jgi:NADPH2:quinone reductase
MTQMQALFIDNAQLIMRQCTQPVPAADEVLIKVAYAGLNRADIFQRQWNYPAPNAQYNVAGLEVSGQIAAMGADAQGWALGDEVCALLDGGGYAEYAIAKAAHCLPIPENLSLEQAAALPECVATIWMALMDEAQVQPAERVLIHGGASGIGTTGIQMLRAHGCEVFCTVGSADKAALCEQLGAKAILYKEQDFSAIVKAAGGADVILDMVGGDYIDRGLRCLNVGGRLVSIAFLKGADIELNAARLLLKRQRWIGTTLRARSDSQKADYIAHIRKTVWPWVELGALAPVIDSVFAFSDATHAQEKMQKYLHCGKILLKVGS